MRENEKLHQLVMAAIFAAAIAVTTAYILHIPLSTWGTPSSIWPPACCQPLGPWPPGPLGLGWPTC